MRYLIENNGIYFQTARSNDGAYQYLFGPADDTALFVRFDANGKFLKWGHAGPLHDDEGWAAVWEGFCKKHDCEPGTITVQAFFIDEEGIGTRQRPEHFDEVEANPDLFPADQLEGLRESLRAWEESGDFVLYWFEDYYLDRAGEVQSS